jgi:hypothetical protein
LKVLSPTVSSSEVSLPNLKYADILPPFIFVSYHFSFDLPFPCNYAYSWVYPFPYSFCSPY